jgi:hypothetical protein
MDSEIPVREFDIIRKIGLETCRTCPVGKRNALELHIPNQESLKPCGDRTVHEGSS